MPAHRLTLTPLAVLLAALLGALPAFATDGVLEINQTCAVETGCFTGDSPGYPVTVDGSAGRSIRLTSDLITPDANISGIVISTPDVSIDLNNFAIIRSGCEGATLNCTPGLVSSARGGVYVGNPSFSGLSVKDGSITGMRGWGMVLGTQAQVNNVRVRWNAAGGIQVASGSTVSGNTAYQNGGIGIVADQGATISGNTAYGNGGDGIVADFGSTVSGNATRSNGGDGIFTTNGSAVSGNTAYGNGGDGIQTGQGATIFDNSTVFNGGHGISCSNGSLVRDNAARLNSASGLNLGQGSSYHGNTVSSNGTGQAIGSGAANGRGGNYCAGTGTGSAFCP